MTHFEFDSFVDELNELCEKYGVRVAIDCNCLCVETGYRPYFLGTIYGKVQAFLND
jgi:hypothetical protein